MIGLPLYFLTYKGYTTSEWMQARQTHDVSMSKINDKGLAACTHINFKGTLTQDFNGKNVGATVLQCKAARAWGGGGGAG